MKRLILIILSLGVLIGTAAYLMKKEQRTYPIKEQLEAQKAFSNGDQVSAVNAGLAKPAALAMPAPAELAKEADPLAYLNAPPLSAKEVESARTLIATFFHSEKGKQGLQRFIRDIQTAGLEPVIAKDTNPYTGSMLVVRTKEALEGTRYLHAQFFQDENNNKEPFRQHLSFELRASPDAMKIAKSLIEAAAGRQLGKPTAPPSDQWIEWKLGGQSVWIQRLGKDDIANDPFNARTPADVGTVRVAIEMIPDEGHGKVGDSHAF